MKTDRNVTGQNKLKKIFGIGPRGAIISIFLLIVSVWADSIIGLPILVNHADIMTIMGTILAMSGGGLHFWSFFTLRSWWVDSKLCTKGPFKYFRHPMYAAWITFICPGLALYLNSWFYIFWIFVLHMLWHRLVKKEETVMAEIFGDTYTDYARQTGRFFPKILNIGNRHS